MKREWLRRIRKNKKLTSKQLAEIVGITYQSILHYETGDRTPTVPIAKKIAKELKIDWTKFYED